MKLTQKSHLHHISYACLKLGEALTEGEKAAEVVGGWVLETKDGNNMDFIIVLGIYVNLKNVTPDHAIA